MKLLNKLTSRKFLAAAAGVIAGLSMVFGLNEDIVSSVSGAVMAAGSLITYIVTEGRIDAAVAGNTAQKIQNAVDAIKQGEKTKNA